MTIRGVLGGIGCAILSTFGILTIISIIAMFVPKQCHGQTWRDRDSIITAIDRVWGGTDRGVELAALAIAWEETAGNDSTPDIRGHHCWWSARIDSIPRGVDITGIERVWKDKRGHLRISHRAKNCEVGRFQIKPSTARLRCPTWNVFTYGGNLWCFAEMFTADVKADGVLVAIKHQNGRGTKADEYVRRVLATAGKVAVQEVN